MRRGFGLPLNQVQVARRVLVITTARSTSTIGVDHASMKRGAPVSPVAPRSRSQKGVGGGMVAHSGECAELRRSGCRVS